MERLRRFDRLSLAIGLLVLAAVLVEDSYFVSVLQVALITGILALSVDLMLGYGGLLSIAHSGLFGFGMYTTAILTASHGWGFWQSLPFAIVVTAAIGWTIGKLTLHLSGHYFTFATVVFAAAATTSFAKFDSITNGTRGILGIPRLDSIGPLMWNDPRLTSLIFTSALFFTAFLNKRLIRSGFGQSLLATRDNERLAAALGVNVARHRIVTFTLSSAFAGLAGAFYASWATYATPRDAGILVGFEAAIYSVVGGSGFPWGPPVGTFLLLSAPEWFRAAETFRLALYGFLLIVVVIWLPRGLLGSLSLGKLVASRRTPVRNGEDLMEAEQGSDTASHSDPEPSSMPLLITTRSPSQGKTVLTARELSVAYGGVVAVERVSLDVTAGGLMAIIGPNGAGKTSLFDAIAGRTTASSGRVYLGDTDITDLPMHERSGLGLARTFQAVQFIPEFTVAEHLRLAQNASHNGKMFRSLWAGPESEEVSNVAWTVMDHVDLADKHGVEASQLTLFEQQRLALSMALVSQPSVILLDEPFAGLTHHEDERLMEIINGVRGRGVALCLVEHKMRIIRHLADSVIVLDRGGVIAHGPPGEVMTDPRVHEAYLGKRADA